MRNKKVQLSTTPKVRRLKIQTKLRINKFSRKLVPEIRFYGNWLSEAGFQEGDTVTITTKHNELIIRKTTE